MNDLLNNWSNTTSYATRDNLVKALGKLHLDACKGMVIVRTPEGRWTAIFAKSFLGPDFISVAQKGFKVLG